MNKEDRKKLLENAGRVQHKIVDTAGLIVDVVATGMQRAAQNRKTQEAVARRQVANMLGTSQFCANKACRRSHCCRGEPLHCLQAAIVLLPPEAFEGLVRKKRNTIRNARA